MLRAVYEARIMHGLIGESFLYSELVSACQARLLQQRTAAELEHQQHETPPPAEPETQEATPASDG